ncbi:NAD dependent epimerase/dehydratase family protein [Xylariales sp. PMI_506]|nr:NAD dependent epimerase/dehydratase family protein [Xylariales sp. PMI_506]
MASQHHSKVFLIGPGFIGWSILELLVKENYQVTVMVRRKEHGEQLKATGAANAVLGTLGDNDLISEQTTRHDIVIHTATADDLPSVTAVLDGIQKRAAKGLSTVYIHTSGTSLLDDGCCGGVKSSTVYFDADAASIDALPDSAPHRKIDLAIVRMRQQLGGRAKIAIMIPPLIYGYSNGRLSIQIPTLTRFALKHGYAGYVGDGAPVESNIHVRDLARAYVTLLHHLERSPSTAPAADPVGQQQQQQLLHAGDNNPYYFCETTGDREPSWREIAEQIGASLHAAGRIADPTPRTIDPALYGDLFGKEFTPPVVGLNSRSRAVRLRELGWVPVEKSWRESYVQDELPHLLEEQEDAEAFCGYQGVAAS